MGPIKGEQIRLGQLLVTFFASAAETDGHADVFEVLVPPGARVPVAHHHVEVDEVVYALEGVTTYTLGGVKHELRAGDRLFAPKGVEHHFANLHAEPARFLSVLTPATIGPKFFREVAALAASGPPDPARVGEVMRRHGLVPAAPTPA
ncbi:MAG: cupin domain-containing protein [Polyangiales bacterium]